MCAVGICNNANVSNSEKGIPSMAKHPRLTRGYGSGFQMESSGSIKRNYSANTLYRNDAVFLQYQGFLCHSYHLKCDVIRKRSRLIESGITNSTRPIQVMGSVVDHLREMQESDIQDHPNREHVIFIDCNRNR